MLIGLSGGDGLRPTGGGRNEKFRLLYLDRGPRGFHFLMLRVGVLFAVLFVLIVCPIWFSFCVPVGVSMLQLRGESFYHLLALIALLWSIKRLKSRLLAQLADLIHRNCQLIAPIFLRFAKFHPLSLQFLFDFATIKVKGLSQAQIQLLRHAFDLPHFFHGLCDYNCIFLFHLIGRLIFVKYFTYLLQLIYLFLKSWGCLFLVSRFVGYIEVRICMLSLFQSFVFLVPMSVIIHSLIKLFNQHLISMYQRSVSLQNFANGRRRLIPEWTELKTAL